MGTVPEQLKLLLIDDNAPMARAVSLAIGNDVQTTCVQSAVDALARILEGERYDAILCDVRLPELSGVGLYLRLSRVAPDQAERMIFMTGDLERAGQIQREAPRSRGAIGKPFSIADLRKLLWR